MTDFSGIHSQYSGLSGYGLALTRCEGESFLPRHQHAAPFLSFVFHGAYAEGQGSRMLDCSTNHITWHPPEDAHEIRHGAEVVTSLQVSFDTPFVEGIDLCSVFSHQRATAFVPGLRPVLNEIRWELTNEDCFTALNLKALVLQALAGLAREFRVLSESPANLAGEVLRRHVEERVQAAFPNPPDFTELAQELCLSETRLVSLYRRACGESPGATARQYRLSRTCELLRESGLPLAQIAVDAGYYDQSHLTRDFVRRMGCTPGAYRRQYH